ncbi:hypothetical protein Rsub_05572 [Raphidocelis subcapitata]|uniref:Peptidase M14 domain-containing protein n=1 Tax=Raphidocelis subcapitata TaxID=307507 RepID=A0A2V0P3E0_9CHLO|nr:hypothetical protein Rsub_05572 [Raphidocelis subcapitata]|eukprot:GBF92370.1 hypothetical protein Rsub_05572 [Raphidocelis subcapitata]
MRWGRLQACGGSRAPPWRAARRARPAPLLPLLLLALALAHAPRPAACLYHTASETLHWFAHKARSHPERLNYTLLTDSFSGTAVPLATLGRPAGAPGAPRVLFVFGEHCREVITSEVGLWLGRLLADENATVRDWPELHAALERAGEPPPPPGGGGWRGAVGAWAGKLLSAMTVQIVPIESLEGRRQVEAGDLCLRRTAGSEVDLNRNWPFAWQHGSPSSDTYGGPSPLSEPQTRLLRAEMDAAPLAGYVNVHSGEWALYTPWDSKPAYAPGLPADLPKLVERVAAVCGCTAGPAGAVSGYLAFGSSMDYAYMHSKVPYPLTVEVFGGDGHGKLPAGSKNAPMSEFPLVMPTEEEAASVAASARRHAAAGAAAGAAGLGRRGALLRRARRAAGGGAGAAAAAGGGRRLAGAGQEGRQSLALSAVFAAPAWQGAGDQSQQQQQQPQQQPQHQAKPAQQRRALLDAAAADALLSAYEAAPDGARRCFEIFNPRDEAAYRKVVGDWLAAFLIILRHISEHSGPQAAGAAAAGAAASGAEAAAAAAPQAGAGAAAAAVAAPAGAAAPQAAASSAGVQLSSSGAASGPAGAVGAG